MSTPSKNALNVLFEPNLCFSEKIIKKKKAVGKVLSLN